MSFSFILTSLEQPATRTAAAALLSTRQYEATQLRRLATHFATAGVLERPLLLKAFSGESDAAAGLALVAALDASAALASTPRTACARRLKSSRIPCSRRSRWRRRNTWPRTRARGWMPWKKTCRLVISSAAPWFSKPESVTLTVGAAGPEVRVPKSDIKSLAPGQFSLMPQGLDLILTPQELADVVAFLQSQR